MPHYKLASTRVRIWWHGPAVQFEKSAAALAGFQIVFCTGLLITSFDTGCIDTPFEFTVPGATSAKIPLNLLAVRVPISQTGVLVTLNRQLRAPYR